MEIRPQTRQMIAGYLCALGATALWSGNFLVARGLNESISPVSLAFWRWVVAVIFFLPFALKPLMSEWETLKKHWKYLVVTSILGITVFNTLIYIAGHTTGAINLSLISITCPIFIVILSRFLFRERITVNKGMGILFVVIGVVLLITRGRLSILVDVSFAIGDVWMLLAAAIFAVYTILLRQKPHEISVWAFQLSTFLLGLIFLTPFFLWEHATVPAFEMSKEIIFSILYVGIFASLSAFILWSKAVTSIGPTKAGIVYYTIPVFSGLLAHLFLGENIEVVHLCSIVFILSGVVIANYTAKTQQPERKMDNEESVRESL